LFRGWPELVRGLGQIGVKRVTITFGGRRQKADEKGATGERHLVNGEGRDLARSQQKAKEGSESSVMRQGERNFSRIGGTVWVYLCGKEN